MSVRILFFGATADVVGAQEIQLSPTGGETSGDVFDAVLRDHPGLRNHKLLFSVNQEFASRSEPVRDGDELAIFTAVSGG
ncbi:MAG: MoaD/ThiS family protein [Acidobacteriota bacterium]